MGAKVENLEYALRAVGKARTKDAINIAEGLEKAANILLTASKKLVPVDTGELKASGKVVVKGKGLGAVAFVIYEAEHAIWVHENLENRHEPPTQARYLADAVPKVRGTITAMLKRQFTVGRSGGPE